MRYGSSHRERVTSAVWSFFCIACDDLYAAATSIRRREKKLTVRPKEGCHRGGQRGKASLMGNPTEDGVIMGNGSGCYGIIQHTYIAFLQLLKICAVKKRSNLLTEKKKQQNPGFPFFKNSLLCVLFLGCELWRKKMDFSPLRLTYSLTICAMPPTAARL